MIAIYCIAQSGGGRQNMAGLVCVMWVHKSQTEQI